MIARIQAWLQTDAGKAVGILGALVCLGAGIYILHGMVGPSAAEQIGNERMYIDAEGNTFTHAIVSGEKLPVYSSASGKEDGYPAEECWWTPDGQIASQPTYVLLNSYIGKSGPTFCPVCHRMVHIHNPAPRIGETAPQTEQEYNQRNN